MKTTSEYLNIYRNYKKMMTNLTSQIVTYGWSVDYCMNLIKDLYNKLTKEFDNCDFTKFTSDQLKELDWGFWDENIILMPIWAIDCLPDEQVVYSIDNRERVFHKSIGIDKEDRFGLTAWGLNISQLRDTSINSILS